MRRAAQNFTAYLIILAIVVGLLSLLVRGAAWLLS